MIKFYLFLSLIWIGSALSSTTIAQANNCGPAWENKAKWTDETEADYQEWMRSKYPRDLYSRKDNPFKGVEGHPFKDIDENPYSDLYIDCSDHYCIARAIYAHGRNLPFTFRNGSTLTNSSPHCGKNNVERFRKFIFSLMGICDTYAIDINTFMVDPTKIAPGDVYRFNYLVDLNKPEGRHAHVVKDVLKNGNIHYYWSSLPAFPRLLSAKIGAPELAPMTYVNGKLNILSMGFRRFYQPEDYNLPMAQMVAAQERRGRDDRKQRDMLNNILEESAPELKDLATKLTFEGASYVAKAQGYQPNTPAFQNVVKERSTPIYYNYNYRKAAEDRVSRPFYHAIADALRTGPRETVAELVERIFANTCSAARDRIQNVYEGLLIRQTLLRPNKKAKCMSQKETDAYDTPGRDKQMTAVFMELYELWISGGRYQLSPEQKLVVPSRVKQLLDNIFPRTIDEDRNRPVPAMSEALYKACPIDFFTTDHAKAIYKTDSIESLPPEYRKTMSMDLRQLWVNIINRRLSPDPHDPVEQRWGIKDILPRERGYNCDP